MFGKIFGGSKKRAVPDPSDKTLSQTLQETFIQEQQSHHSSQSLQQILEYQFERQEKINLINQKIVANGIDMEEFLQKIASQKENGQNVDFLELDEIMKFIEKEQSMHQDFSKLSNIDMKVQIQLKKSYIQRGYTIQNYQINRDSGSTTFAKKPPQIRATQKISGTVFNRNKHVVCQVSVPVLAQQTDFYSSNTLDFEIQTFPFNWKIRRTPKDFIHLREYLLKMYPQTIVPSLPIINPKKPKLTLKQVKRKAAYYERFLYCVMKSQVLRSAEFLVEFLREPDTDQFYQKVIAAKYNKGPDRLEQISTLFGDVDVTAGKRAKRVCRKLPRYIETYSEITTFLKGKLNDIHKKSSALANDYFAIATEIQRFSTLTKTIQIPQITQLYEKLSHNILRTGDFILQSGHILKTQLSPWFAYNRDETQAYMDQKELIEQSRLKYETKLKELNEKKMSLFKKGDIKLWKVSDEAMEDAQSAKTDQVMAFRMMLPIETTEVQAKKEEWEYFTKCAYKELKRVTGLNYDMARETFVNVSEMLARIIYQMNLSWQDFLQYYTGINTERKAYDEKFFEERGILEEFEDQIPSSDGDEDSEDLLNDDVPGSLVPDEELFKEKREEWKVQGDWL